MNKAKRILTPEKVRGHVFVTPNLVLFNFLRNRPVLFMENEDFLRKMGRTSAGWQVAHLHETANLLLNLRRDGASMVFVNSKRRDWVNDSEKGVDKWIPAPPTSPEVIENFIREINDVSRVPTSFQKYALISDFLLKNTAISPKDFLNASQMLLWMGLPLHWVKITADDILSKEYHLIQRMVRSLPNSSLMGKIEPQVMFGIGSCTLFTEARSKIYKIISLKDIEEMEGLSREQMIELNLLERHLNSYKACKVTSAQLEHLIAQAKKEKKSMLPEIAHFLRREVYQSLLKIKQDYFEPPEVLEGRVVEGERLENATEFREKMIEKVPGLDEFPGTLKILVECFEKMGNAPPNWHLQWDFAKGNWRE